MRMLFLKNFPWSTLEYEMDLLMISTLLVEHEICVSDSFKKIKLNIKTLHIKDQATTSDTSDK